MLKLVGVDWLPEVVPWSGVMAVSHWISFTRVMRHAQLLCDQLGLRGKNALAKIALAGIGGDRAVGADGQP